jgi:phosphodiesterase/alkaline phosphatase D-like protein
LVKIRHGIWLLSIPVFCAASLRAAVTFSSVEARQARDTTAIILWHNEVPGTIPAPLAGQVEYGPDAGYGSQTPQDDFSFFHSVTLNGLAPSTTYHYRLRVKDRGDVETLSEDHTFVTLSAPAAQSVTGIAPNSAGGNGRQ